MRRDSRRPVNDFLHSQLSCGDLRQRADEFADADQAAPGVSRRGGRRGDPGAAARPLAGDEGNEPRRVGEGFSRKPITAPFGPASSRSIPAAAKRLDADDFQQVVDLVRKRAEAIDQFGREASMSARSATEASLR